MDRISTSDVESMVRYVEHLIAVEFLTKDDNFNRSEDDDPNSGKDEGF